ncbi:MAG TPA: hypothetical protein VM755_09270 [Stellaceae bacterium]|nr:hypothetical protein [Stellaceae bacterium]
MFQIAAKAGALIVAGVPRQRPLALPLSEEIGEIPYLRDTLGRQRVDLLHQSLRVGRHRYPSILPVCRLLINAGKKQQIDSGRPVKSMA